jgi:thiol-disulfide isomerase/thioredoxin
MKRWTFALFSAIFLATAVGSPDASRAGAQPSLAPVLGANDWYIPKVSAADVRGKVVIVDVFTVDCINCQNVTPTLRDLYNSDRTKGLEVIGIHTPETASEKQRGYVTRTLRRLGVVWPVAVDNDHALWDTYGVDAWPTQLFFDRHGRLRKTIVGDSQDDAVRATVNALLAEKK